MPAADTAEKIALGRRVAIPPTVAHRVVIGDGVVEIVGEEMAAPESLEDLPPGFAGTADNAETAGAPLEFVKEVGHKRGRDATDGLYAPVFDRTLPFPAQQVPGGREEGKSDRGGEEKVAREQRDEGGDLFSDGESGAELDGVIF